MKVYLAKKDGAVIYHTDLTAMEQLDGISEPDKTVTIEKWEAAGSVAYIDSDGEIKLGIPPDVKAKQDETASLEKEAGLLLAELAGKDYKVVKAAETGQSLSLLDPDLHERRKYCRNRINEIRARLDELNGLLKRTI
jgi:hypothetical protein